VPDNSKKKPKFQEGLYLYCPWGVASVKLQYQMSGGWWSEIRIACGRKHAGITG